MKTSKTAVFTSHLHPLEIRAIPVPPLNKGEILVRNEYTTLCRSDLYTYSGKRQEATPTILGHEITGRIEAFGDNGPCPDLRNNLLAKGDRISWAIFTSDPGSDLARQGIPQKGEGLFKYGHERLTEESVLHGGLSEYIILRPHTPVIKIDESLPLGVAAIINCAVATVAGAMRLAGDVQGKHVLISGAGMLGMIACAMCRVKGAVSVSALDVSPERLNESSKFGADNTFLADQALAENIRAHFEKTNPFHVVIELSGVASATEQAIEMLAIGGTAVLPGATYPERPLQLNAEKIVRNLLTLKGLHNYNREDFRVAVEFMEQHHSEFPFAGMIHEGFTLTDINEAFDHGLKVNPFRVGVKIE